MLTDDQIKVLSKDNDGWDLCNYGLLALGWSVDGLSTEDVRPYGDFVNEQLEIVNKLTGFNMRMEVSYDDKDKDIRGNSAEVHSESDLSSDSDE